MHGLAHELANRIDKSRICRTLATFRPSFAGFKVRGIEPSRGSGAHADHRSRRRRPQHPDLGLDRARGRRLSDHDLYRRRLARSKASRPRRPISPSSTSRCRAWTAWRLLRRLRQKTDMPVIFLTSKDEEIDELFGLKMGADDFIRKPFSQRLLVERVKAVLRRVDAEGRHAAPKETDRQGARARPAAHGPRAPHLHLEERAGHAHRHRIPDPAGAGRPAPAW